MSIQESLRSAARNPENWDVPGLLNDAADRLDDLEAGNETDGESIFSGEWTAEEIIAREG